MINAFSIIVAFIYLFLIIKTIWRKKGIKHLYLSFFLLNIIFELFIGVGYFIRIGNTEILYSEFSLLMLFIVSVFLLFNKKIQPKEYIAIIILLGSACLSFILPIIFNDNTAIMEHNEYWEILYEEETIFKTTPAVLNSHSFLLLFRIIIFVFCFSAGKDILFNKNTIKQFFKIFHIVASLYIFLFFFEFACKYFFNSNTYAYLVNSIFGIGQGTYATGIYRSGMPALQGLYKEPSHLSMNMFIISCALLASSKIKGSKTNLKLFLLNLYSILSVSLSAVIFVGAFILIFFRYGKKNMKLKNVFFLIVFFVVACLILFKIPYFSHRINSVFNVIELVRTDSLFQYSFSETSGEVPRIVSILYCLKWFGSHLFFGVGLGNTYSHSFLPSMLCNIGLIGFLAWIFYLKKIKNVGKLDFITILCLIFVFSFQGLLGYFYTISFVYVFLLYFYKFNERRKEVYARNCNC